MVYLDTSVIVPLFVPEPDSSAIREWFGQAGGGLAISDWTLTEFASAMGIKVRQKGLKPDQARTACRLLERLAADSLQVLTPARADFARASAYLDQHALGLRAGDALHLAIAENAGAETVFSTDRQFIKGGRHRKIKTASPI